MKAKRTSAPQKAISNIETAILGLLLEGPRHGYDIEKMIEERGMRYWTEIGFSSIYYVLRRLEGRKLVASDLCPGEAGKPARRIYALSALGRSMLKEKIRTLLSAFINTPRPYDLGIMFSEILSKEEIAESNHQYALSLERRLGFINELALRWKNTESPVASLAIRRFNRQKALVQAEKNWIVHHPKKKTDHT